MSSKNGLSVRLRRRERSCTKQFGVLGWITGGILIVYCVLLLFPLIWAFLNTFKFQDDFVGNVLGLPEKEFGWTTKNYETAFMQFYMAIGVEKTKVYMEMMFLNSVLYAAGCAFMATLTPCIVSYLVAKYRFKFGKIIYGLVIVTMIIPIVGSLPSEYTLVTQLGLKDSFLGMWYMKCNFLGTYFLVFYAAWKSTPTEFIEAGRVDGISEFGILTRVMLPLVATTFGIIFVLNFIGFWNDYQTPMLYMPSYPTISYGLYDLYNGLGAMRNDVATDVMKLTLATVVMVPILALFLALKDKLIGNLTVGGIKG